MSNLLFPFSSKYHHLDKRWWHRFFKSIGFLLGIIVLIAVVMLSIMDDGITSLRSRNSEKVYIVDNLIDGKIAYPSYYDLYCDQGGSDIKLYNTEYFDSSGLEEYVKRFSEFVVIIDDLKKYEFSKSYLLSLLRFGVQSENSTINLLWDNASKTVDIKRVSVDSEHIYCIYGGQYFDPVSNIVWGYDKEECVSNNGPNNISISADNYDKLYGEIAERMKNNSNDELRRNYTYKRNSSLEKNIKIFGKLTSLKKGVCSPIDIFYYSKPIYFKILDGLVGLIIFYMVILLIQVFYYKVVVYIIYGDGSDYIKP